MSCSKYEAYVNHILGRTFQEKLRNKTYMYTPNYLGILQFEAKH